MTSNVTGTVLSSQNTERAALVVSFAPLLGLSRTDTTVVGTKVVTATTDGSGIFTVALYRGDYYMTFPGGDRLHIRVPGDGLTYPVLNLLIP